MADEINDTITNMQKLAEEAMVAGRIQIDTYNKITKMNTEFLSTQAKAMKELREDTRDKKVIANEQIKLLEKLHIKLKHGIIDQQEFNEQSEEAAIKLQQLQKTLDPATKAAARKALQDIKNLEISKKAHEEFGASMAKLTSDLVGKTTTAIGGILTSIQSGAEGFKTASSILTAGVDLIGTAAQGGADAIGGIGTAMSASGNKFGIVVQGLGAAVGLAGKAFTAYEQFRIKFMTAEVAKISNAYKQASTAGVLFADGLTGMVRSAGEAGLSVDQMGNVISKNTEELRTSGLGVSGGMKLVGKVMKIMQSDASGASDQLLNLGIGYEEQAGIIASYTARMQMSGKLQSMTNDELAETSLKYAKDLKTLADITGGDAKKKLEQATLESNRVAIIAKLSADQRIQFQNAWAASNDIQRKGLVEYIASGGKAITDSTNNLLMTTSQAYTESVKGVGDKILRGEVVTTAYVSGLRRKAAEEVRATGGEVGTAMILSGGKINAAAGDFAKGLDTVSNDISMATEAEVNAKESSATTTDDATKKLMGVEKEAQKQRLEVQTLALKALPGMASDMQAAMKTLTAALNPSVWDRVTTAASAAAAALLGVAAGGAASLIPKMGGLFGKTKAVGTVAGGLAKSGAGDAELIAGLAKVTGKGAAMGMGKAVLSKLPLVGLGIGLIGAADKISKGDYIGASLEAGAGAAAMIPGVGTALSIGLSGASIARDMGAFDSTAPATTPTTTPTETTPTVSPTVDTGSSPSPISNATSIQDLLIKQVRISEQTLACNRELIGLTNDLKSISSKIFNATV